MEPHRAFDYLNQSVRRMIAAQNPEEWKRAVLDAAAPHAGRTMLWHVGSTPPPPAIAAALESKETTIAAVTASELSEEIARAAEGAGRIYIFPLGEIQAVLMAASADGQPNTAALELIAQVAGLTLVRIRARAEGFVGIAAPQAKPRDPVASLSADERRLHLRAQRFARAQVAEMQLYHDRAVKAGRKSKRIYDNLKPYIDRARNQFREQFLSASRTMVDYLHVELIRTLANDDEALLGLEYPGSLH